MSEVNQKMEESKVHLGEKNQEDCLTQGNDRKKSRPRQCRTCWIATDDYNHWVFIVLEAYPRRNDQVLLRVKNKFFTIEEGRDHRSIPTITQTTMERRHFVKGTPSKPKTHWGEPSRMGTCKELGGRRFSKDWTKIPETEKLKSNNVDGRSCGWSVWNT